MVASGRLGRAEGVAEWAALARDTAAALDCTHGPEAGDPYFAPPVPRSFLEEARTPPGRLRIAFTAQMPNGRPRMQQLVQGNMATMLAVIARP